MRKLRLLLLGFGLIAWTSTVRAQQTWTGEISDSHCNAEHEPLAEGDPVLPSPECVKLCLKSGFKYVMVIGEKVYMIANQNNTDLDKFAGREVKVTGEMKGDSITITKVESAAPGADRR